MKASLSILAAMLLVSAAQAQTTFHKGSVLISLSEGATYARYKTIAPSFMAGVSSSAIIAPTTNDGPPKTDVINDGNSNGDRDPLCIEYGVSDHIGISISMGGDVLNIKPVKYYNAELPGKTKAITSETTFDIKYHFFVTHKVDISAYFSVGLASLNLRNYDLGRKEDQGYTYQEIGSIVRLGTRARYYFGKKSRVGLVAMASAFVSNTSSTPVDGNTNTIAAGHSTKIRGCAIEVGPCIRLRK